MKRTEDPSDASGTPLLSSRAQGRLSLALLALLVAGAGAVAFTTLVEGAPTKDDPGFIDVIFASSITVAATRAAIVFAAGYVAASVVGLVLARRWLIRFGPVEASELAVQAERRIAELELEQLRHELEDSKRQMRKAGSHAGEGTGQEGS